METLTTKQKLTQAFKQLRKAGYFARQNYKCCQSCGWAAVPESQADKAVFYHGQDNEAFDYLGQIKRGESLRLAWSGDGQEITTALRAAGLSVEWDGSADRRIKVLA